MAWNILMDIIIVTIIGIAINISGTIITKYLAMNVSNTPVMILLSLALIFAMFLRVVYWVVIGKKYQLSFIYPLLGINYLLSFLLGIVLFNEAFQTSRLIGSIIILAGVIIVSYSDNKYEEFV
jgi:multidrug transporter EmrE-like cation transporter